jgi:hypothetical protein
VSVRAHGREEHRGEPEPEHPVPIHQHGNGRWL